MHVHRSLVISRTAGPHKRLFNGAIRMLRRARISTSTNALTFSRPQPPNVGSNTVTGLRVLPPVLHRIYPQDRVASLPKVTPVQRRNNAVMIDSSEWSTTRLILDYDGGDGEGLGGGGGGGGGVSSWCCRLKISKLALSFGQGDFCVERKRQRKINHLAEFESRCHLVGMKRKWLHIKRRDDDESEIPMK